MTDLDNFVTCDLCYHNVHPAKLFQHVIDCHRQLCHGNLTPSLTDPITCTICNTTVTAATNYAVHVHLNHVLQSPESESSTALLCSHCSFTSSDSKLFENHKIAHLTSTQICQEPNIWKCPVCDALFNSIHDAKSHQSGCTAGQDITCNICQRSCTSLLGMRYHLQSSRHLNKQQTRKMSGSSVCEPMNYITEDNIIVKRHNYTLFGFSCHVCKRHFSVGTRMPNHALTKTHMGNLAILQQQKMQDPVYSTQKSSPIINPHHSFTLGRETPNFIRHPQYGRDIQKYNTIRDKVTDVQMSNTAFPFEGHQIELRKDGRYYCYTCCRFLANSANAIKHIKSRNHLQLKGDEDNKEGDQHSVPLPTRTSPAVVQGQSRHNEPIQRKPYPFEHCQHHIQCQTYAIIHMKICRPNL